MTEFFHRLKKYQNVNTFTEATLIEKEHKYIIKAGETVSIFEETVKLEDIIAYFKERMSWIKFHVNPDIIKPMGFYDKLTTKIIIYEQLAAALEQSSLLLNQGFRTSRLVEDFVDENLGVTIH